MRIYVGKKTRVENSQAGKPRHSQTAQRDITHERLSLACSNALTQADDTLYAY